MSLALRLLALHIGAAAADCLGTVPVIFHDLHDGDSKQMTLSPFTHFDFMIVPHGNNETWVVHGTFDVNCVATIDFNVPGKPNPPPLNLTASLWVMQSVADAHHVRYGLEFTDKTSKLAPATQPLNFWVSDLIIGPHSVRAARSECLDTPWLRGLVLDDMHDGDMKTVSVRHDALHITPHGNQEHWRVDTKFGSNCVASVDFNVPGKPNPPPVPLEATVWGMAAIDETLQDKDVLVFADPSATIAPATKPLNAWIPDNKLK